MAVLDIVYAPDPILKTKTTRVATVDERIRRLMDDMLETMYAAPGIGLAAPQVGSLDRVLVVDIAAGDATPEPLRMANPELVRVTDDTAEYEEGCLSFPDLFATVRRPTSCRVRYLDTEGKTREVDADGLLAVCLQHEIDHLNGILFTDHLSALRRNMLMRKMVKFKKERAA